LAASTDFSSERVGDSIERVRLIFDRLKQCREGAAASSLPRQAAGLRGQRAAAAGHEYPSESGHGLYSRCTVSGEKAGRQTAMYSAPSGAGLL
jgi:hypothetical protein